MREKGQREANLFLRSLDRPGFHSLETVVEENAQEWENKDVCI